VLLATRKFDVLCIPVLAGCFVVWQHKSFLFFAQAYSSAPSLFPDTASLLSVLIIGASPFQFSVYS
jgi:hypothetical protein